MKNLFTSKDLKLVDLSQKIVPPGTPTVHFGSNEVTYTIELGNTKYILILMLELTLKARSFFENGKDLEQFSLKLFAVEPGFVIILTLAKLMMRLLPIFLKSNWEKKLKRAILL